MLPHSLGGNDVLFALHKKGAIIAPQNPTTQKLQNLCAGGLFISTLNDKSIVTANRAALICLETLVGTLFCQSADERHRMGLARLLGAVTIK